MGLLSNSRLSRDFSRDMSPTRAPLLVTDGVEVTQDAVWVWLQVQLTNTDLLEEKEADGLTYETARDLQTLIPAQAAYHIKTVWSPYSASEYRQSVAHIGGALAPQWNEFIDLQASKIEAWAQPPLEGHELQYRRKHLLVGVQVQGGQSGRRDVAEVLKGYGSPRTQAKDAHTRLERAEPAIRELASRFGEARVLRASLAPAGLIAWAYAREFRRDPQFLPSRHQELTRAQLAGLIDGEAMPSRDGRYMVVTDAPTGRRTYVAVLVPAAVAGFPATELTNPGSEWLLRASQVPGVEVSVRGMHYGYRESLKMLATGSRMVKSQLDEALAVGGDAVGELMEAEELIGERRDQVRNRTAVEGVNHPRWIVEADSVADLQDRVAQLRDRYAGLVELIWATHVQDLLWQETLPGDVVRVPEFAQEQPLITLAGSWFHGGSALGDEIGPYAGKNIGWTPNPVQVHVVRRDGGHRNDKTTIVSVGDSGMGKSTALMWLTLGALAEGAWAILPDVKGDLAGCVKVARDLLGVPTQMIDISSPESAGMLDPFRFSADPDDARSHAVTALQSSLSEREMDQFGAIIEAAVDRVMHGDPTVRSMPAVLGALASAGAGDPNRELWHEAAQLLQVRGQQRGLRPVLQAGRQAAISGDRGLVYMNVSSLPLPPDTTPPAQWSSPERSAIVSLTMAFAFAMEQSRTRRSLKKLVVLPELHRITGLDRGIALVAHLARMGRALQTYQLLDTQGAADLVRVPQLTEQVVMAFAFRGSTEAEQRAQATLLRRPDPGPVLMGTLASLDRRECVMSDRYNRLGVMEFDLLTPEIERDLDTAAAEDTGEDHHAPAAQQSPPVPPIPPESPQDDGWFADPAPGSHNGHRAPVAPLPKPEVE